VSDRPTHLRDQTHSRVKKRQQLRALESFLKLASRLHVYLDMSVLRTMSLIVGGALVALGGSALALFL